MFNNNFEFKVLKEKTDLNGFFFVCLNIACDKHRLTLLLLYGPNTDCPYF